MGVIIKKFPIAFHDANWGFIFLSLCNSCEFLLMTLSDFDLILCNAGKPVSFNFSKDA